MRLIEDFEKNGRLKRRSTDVIAHSDALELV